jgi:hypothetical protein
LVGWPLLLAQDSDLDIKSPVVNCNIYI